MRGSYEENSQIGVGLLTLLRSSLALPLQSEQLTISKAQRLVSLLADRSKARIVGLEYLRVVPPEANVAFLVSSLCAQTEVTATSGSRDVWIERSIKKRHQSDLEYRRIVKLRGWNLSQTECRLCALSTLV
jgi:hypothetical protein